MGRLAQNGPIQASADFGGSQVVCLRCAACKVDGRPGTERTRWADFLVSVSTAIFEFSSSRRVASLATIVVIFETASSVRCSHVNVRFAQMRQFAALELHRLRFLGVGDLP